MAGRITQLLSIALVAAAASGCASAPTRFYILAPTATADGGGGASYAVGVGPVSVPSSVDRPQIVLQVAPNRVAVDEFNCWAAPLNESVSRAVVGNLVALLGTPRVAGTPLANFDPVYRVTIDVQRFDSVRAEAVLIEAVWVVRKSTGGTAQSGRTVARETVEGDGFDAVAAAHSRALARLSSDIAAAIRADAEAEAKSPQPQSSNAPVGSKAKSRGSKK